jgi:hypothetical protein
MRASQSNAVSKDLKGQIAIKLTLKINLLAVDKYYNILVFDNKIYIYLSA